MKYFCEQAPAVHLVAAGSLLGVSVGKTTGFPVGKVNFLTLYPLSFFEFLEALGEEVLLALLRGKKDFEPLAGLLHEKLSSLLRVFLFTGGMPEAVQCYCQTRDYAAVRAIQKDMLNARLDGRMANVPLYAVASFPNRLAAAGAASVPPG